MHKYSVFLIALFTCQYTNEHQNIGKFLAKLQHRLWQLFHKQDLNKFNLEKYKQVCLRDFWIPVQTNTS